jgi:16S rRNA (adenine1518-N6/adenine1519-N6)-dimethyltransferase
MDYRSYIKDLIVQDKIHLKSFYDQNFLVNQDRILEFIEILAPITTTKVLEIGSGLGFITDELTKKTLYVTAVEIDNQFIPFYSKTNCTFLHEDIHQLLKNFSFGDVLPFDIVVGNIPFRVSQSILLDLARYKYKGRSVFIVPLSFVDKVNHDGILQLFYKAKVITILDKNDFYPKPQTSSAIVEFKYRDGEKEQDSILFLMQYLFDHPKAKVKNALKEGLITLYSHFENTILTQRQAITKVSAFKMEEKLLARFVYSLNALDYSTIASYLKAL